MFCIFLLISGPESSLCQRLFLLLSDNIFPEQDRTGSLLQKNWCKTLKISQLLVFRWLLSDGNKRFVMSLREIGGLNWKHVFEKLWGGRMIHDKKTFFLHEAHLWPSMHLCYVTAGHGGCTLRVIICVTVSRFPDYKMQHVNEISFGNAGCLFSLFLWRKLPLLPVFVWGQRKHTSHISQTNLTYEHTHMKLVLL